MLYSDLEKYPMKVGTPEIAISCLCMKGRERSAFATKMLHIQTVTDVMWKIAGKRKKDHLGEILRKLSGRTERSQHKTPRSWKLQGLVQRRSQYLMQRTGQYLDFSHCCVKSNVIYKRCLLFNNAETNNSTNRGSTCE